MTRLRFDGVQEVDDYIAVPEGTYVVRVAEVRPGLTRAGDERWGLRLVVDEGQFIGSQAAWDGLSFSERGLPRVQRVLQAFGLPFEGEVELQPDDLKDRRAIAQVRPSEYQDPTGRRVRRNEVPYDGYRAVLDAEDNKPAPTGANGLPADLNDRLLDGDAMDDNPVGP